MSEMPTELKLSLTLFGSTGDLAKRKLYPAIFNLFKKGYLQTHFAVIGTARQDISSVDFQQMVAESLRSFSSAAENEIQKFIEHFSYISHDVTDATAYTPLEKQIEQAEETFQTEGNRIFYMSVAPRFFGTIAQSLKSEGLLTEVGYNRLMIEKPFGTSFDTAQELQNQLESGFEDNQLFRIDHYLGKEMVQNIAAIRFGNPIFSNIWNKDYISNIQVTLSETLGVEERAGYYDTAGALFDMIQNHTMQIVGWLAMETPEKFEDRAIRDAKNTAFDALKIYSNNAEVSQNFVRGQYDTDASGEQKAYAQEDGVAENTQTNTFVAGKLQFDTPRWEGVPFYVRSGKRLAQKATRIDIVFKPSTFNFGETVNAPKESVLSILIDPSAGVNFQINAKDVTDSFMNRPIDLNWQASESDKQNTPEPYERMIHDVMNNDGSNFADWHGVADSWKFIDQITKTFSENGAPLNLYKSGSMGPEASDQLLANDGNEWIFKG